MAMTKVERTRTTATSAKVLPMIVMRAFGGIAARILESMEAPATAPTPSAPSRSPYSPAPSPSSRTRGQCLERAPRDEEQRGSEPHPTNDRCVAAAGLECRHKAFGDLCGGIRIRAPQGNDEAVTSNRHESTGSAGSERCQDRVVGRGLVQRPFELDCLVPGSS